MAVCRIIYEIKRAIGQKSLFFIPAAFSAPIRGSHWNIGIPFHMEKLE